MKTAHPFLLIAAIGTALLTSACGRQQAEPTTTEQPAAVAANATPVEETVALPRTASAEGASVFFIAPADGDTVSNPVTIEFGIAGMSVVPAGVQQPLSGHHHLLIDTGLPDPSLPIPADEKHVHFGTGATSTELMLEPGEHTLQMLLGDYLHIPHDPPLTSATITVIVE